MICSSVTGSSSSPNPPVPCTRDSQLRLVEVSGGTSLGVCTRPILRVEPDISLPIVIDKCSERSSFEQRANTRKHGPKIATEIASQVYDPPGGLLLSKMRHQALQLLRVYMHSSIVSTCDEGKSHMSDFPSDDPLNYPSGSWRSVYGDGFSVDCAPTSGPFRLLL